MKTFAHPELFVAYDNQLVSERPHHGPNKSSQICPETMLLWNGYVTYVGVSKSDIL